MLFNSFIQTNAYLCKTRLNHLAALALPAACLLCGANASADNLCHACFHDLPILPHHCPQCAHFLPGNDKNELLCGRCLKQPPPFQRTYALFPYYPPIISMVSQLKFKHQLAYASLFGNLFIKKIRQHWYREDALPDVIIPVPLHITRLRERGFNQAYEIAHLIAKSLNIPIDAHGVKRQKITGIQHQLSATQRKLNIQNAFSTNGIYSGKKIAVIDDVITTGQTVSELCRLLMQQNISHIDVWCVARQGEAEAKRLTRTP